ncbi:MAG: N-6 DNA methylase [Lachnospiraceae bacterium]|nr:N-6 DNA methylase [Lachnospiraceae bacterium]
MRRLIWKGKNQNELSDAHIQRIVDAYKDRKDIDKFAHVASMKEIEENGFDLNIPRYVDTSEAEEEIDIDAVTEEIEKIDVDIAQASKELKKSFQELGLKFPF